MIERAIENWLTNTTERYYQSPFCQLLLAKGHKIIYNSKHGQMEQGKDIFSIDPDGNYIAFQLKTGNINLSEWRSFSGEIRELIELPFVHPDIEKTKLHQSFLVTNGEISDPVRFQIDQMNEDNKRKERNYSYLHLVTFRQLLKEFIDSQAYFLPVDLLDFRNFLMFFVSEGKGFLDKEELFKFYDSSVFTKDPKKTSDFINVIAGSVILNSYLLSSYEKQKNHFAMFEAWVILGACIARFASKYQIPAQFLKETWDIILSEVLENLRLLKSEVLDRQNYLEGELMGDGGITHEFRKTLVLGTIAAYEIFLIDNKKNYTIDDAIIAKLKTSYPPILPGESFFPLIFAMIKFFEKTSNPDTGQQLLQIACSEILSNNSPYSQQGLPTPYYGPLELLRRYYRLSLFEIDLGNFPGSSYTLEPIIEMMVRRNHRTQLEVAWRTITKILLQSFVPDNPEDFFSWRAEKGVNYTVIPKPTQSWKELVASSSDTKSIPSLLVQHRSFLLFYLIVCPHRIDKFSVRTIDT